jgi:hypothetical protein
VNVEGGVAAAETTIVSPWVAEQLVELVQLLGDVLSVTVVIPLPVPELAAVIVGSNPAEAVALLASGEDFVRVLALATVSLLAFVVVDVPSPLEVAATNVPLTAWLVLLRAVRA